jgi:uncharacterized protein (TIGR02391 family)
VYQSLSSLVPNVEDLLALEVEEAGGVLLVHLNSYDAAAPQGVVQHGRVNRYNFFLFLNNQPAYSNRRTEVEHVLMEAWGWLESEGFLVRDGSTNDSFFLSRRAQRLKSRGDVDAYRKGTLLPKGQLHELIAAKVYPAFLRGEYETAVFQAFREIEIAVRNTGNFSAESYGKDLMRDAFRPVNRPEKPVVKPGPLTDTSLPVAEQEGIANLFAGAIALYKNPQSHRYVPTEPIDAAEVIVFASHLLRMVDRISGGTKGE